MSTGSAPPSLEVVKGRRLRRQAHLATQSSSKTCLRRFWDAAMLACVWAPVAPTTRSSALPAARPTLVPSSAHPQCNSYYYTRRSSICAADRQQRYRVLTRIKYHPLVVRRVTKKT